MSNLIEDFRSDDERDQQDRIDVPTIRPAADFLTPGTSAPQQQQQQQFQGTGQDYRSVLQQGNILPNDEVPMPVVSDTGLENSLNTLDFQGVDAGATWTEEQKQFQQREEQRQLLQSDNLGSSITDAENLSIFMPTLFEGPSSTELEKQGLDAQKRAWALLQAGITEGQQSVAEQHQQQALPQTRTDPKQFRPESTKNAFERFVGWLTQGVGEASRDVNFLSSDYGDYGSGFLPGVMYSLNLPFQAVIGAAYDAKRKVRDPLVQQISRIPFVGKTAESMLNWNPITALDQWVNKDTPGHKPLTLFTDNYEKKGQPQESAFINALRGRKIQSFSDYTDKPGSFIGIRSTALRDYLKTSEGKAFQKGLAAGAGRPDQTKGGNWWYDPTFWGGLALDVISDPADLIATGLSKLSKPATVARTPRTPPPSLPKLLNNLPKKPGGIGARLAKPTPKPPKGAKPLPDLRKILPDLGIIPTGVKLPELKPKTPLPDLGGLPKPLPPLGGLKPLPDLTTLNRVSPDIKLPPVTTTKKPVSPSSGGRTTNVPAKAPSNPGKVGQRYRTDINTPPPTKPLPEPANAVSETPKPTVPLRVFSGEYSLSEFADVVSKATPGTRVDPQALNKNRRTLSQLTELARKVPGPDGLPLVPADQVRPFRSWKQLKERIWSLPDPAYRRIFSEYGPKVDEAVLKGDFTIKTPAGDLELAPPPVPEVKTTVDPSVIDPKFMTREQLRKRYMKAADGAPRPMQGQVRENVETFQRGIGEQPARKGNVFEQARQTKEQALSILAKEPQPQKQAEAIRTYTEADNVLKDPKVVQAPTRQEKIVEYLSPNSPQKQADEAALAQGGTFVDPLTGAERYKYQVADQATIDGIKADGDWEKWYVEPAAKFGIKYSDDADLVSRMSVFKNLTNHPPQASIRPGVAKQDPLDFLRQQADEVNNIPREQFAYPDVGPSPAEVRRALNEEVLPSELKLADDGTVQSFLDTRLSVENISEEVRTLSLEVRSAKEALEETLSVLDKTPDLGRQFNDFQPVPNAAPVFAKGQPPYPPEAIKEVVEVYHGTRVQNFNPLTTNPIVGGSRSELGPAMYFTSNSEEALSHANAMIARDLPMVEGRELGAGSVVKAQVNVTDELLDFNKKPPSALEDIFQAAARVALDQDDPIDRMVLKAYYKALKAAKNGQALYDTFDKSVLKVYKTKTPPTKLIDKFQREANKLMAESGYGGWYGTAANGDRHFALFNSRAFGKVDGAEVVNSVDDDALTTIAERFNADSSTAQMYPDSLQAAVKLEESKASLNAQVVHDLENKLEDALDSQTNAVADALEVERMLALEGRGKMRQRRQNLDIAVKSHAEDVAKHLDGPGTPCSY